MATVLDNIPLALAYDDILLVPRECSLSRREVDLSVSHPVLGTFTLPVCSAPMDTVSGVDMVAVVRNAGGLGILHRYMTHLKRCVAIKNILTATPAAAKTPFGIAVGLSVTDAEIEDFLVQAEGAPLILCLDVAHGHQPQVFDRLAAIRKQFPRVPLIAGNVATPTAAVALARVCHGIKVGIGSGSICSTRLETGHGVPQATAVAECVEAVASFGLDTLVIADGGIRYAGDAVKALALGAHMVMLGSMLAGTDESPGDLVGNQKVYRGMASREAQKAFGGKTSSLEGISTTVPRKGPVGPLLADFEARLRSGLTYSGAKNLRDLRCYANFVRQTGAGRFESGTHILSQGGK